MKSEADWVSNRVEAARAARPAVTENAATLMQEFLRGDFGQRQLRPAQLAEAAKELLAAMAPAPSDGDGQA